MPSSPSAKHAPHTEVMPPHGCGGDDCAHDDETGNFEVPHTISYSQLELLTDLEETLCRDQYGGSACVRLGP